MVGVGVVVLPQERWLGGAKERWQQLEAWGFDHAWTYDHLAWRSLADEPWFATVPLLSAAAAVTDVLGLDDVSGGRLLLGLGAGGDGFDAGVIGAAPTRGERTRRFEEFVDVLDHLLTQPVTDHEGEFYEAHGARMIPVPAKRPPFLLAAA